MTAVTSEQLSNPATITLYRQGTELTLQSGINELELSEGVWLFELKIEGPAQVFLDGEPTAVRWTQDGRSAHGSIDLTNRLGFHRFEVRARIHELRFDFCTFAAKATWDEIKAMARVVIANAFSYRRQFVYSAPDGSKRAVRLPEVEFAWIRDRLPEIRTLVEAIGRRPATEASPRLMRSLRAHHVSIPHTLKLLRETPSLLEESAGGPLQVGEKQFWPSAVTVVDAQYEPSRIEHTQLAHFLAQIAMTLNSLLGDVTDDVQSTVQTMRVVVSGMRQLGVVRSHDGQGAHLAWSPLPTPIQRRDSRYGRLHVLHAQFQRDIVIGDPAHDTVRLNVRHAWTIFQAFVAHVIGHALGMSYLSSSGDLCDRDSRGRSMSSEDCDLYYDVVPPADVMRSWRAQTLRPGDERPDVVVHFRSTGKVAVVDAKFSTEPDGTSAKGTDLFEMQGYMNSFGLSAGAIAFPGRIAAPRIVAAQDKMLLEIPLRAAHFFMGDPGVLFEAIANALRSIACFPRPSEQSEAART
jgi:hypothetical protein